MEVLVTGGDTDLGRTIAEHFRDAGHQVVIAGARRDELDVAAKELEVDTIVFDNTDAAKLEAARDQLPHHLDTIINVPASSGYDHTGRVPTGLERADKELMDRLSEQYKEATKVSQADKVSLDGSFAGWSYAHLGLVTIATNPWQRPEAPKEEVVRKGDPVQLLAGNASFSVSRMMLADEGGAIGDTIRVREDRKSPPIFAQIVEMGVVRIPGFNDF